MTTETRTKVIGGLVLAVAVWGLWQVLDSTEKPKTKKKLSGIPKVGQLVIDKYDGKKKRIVGKRGDLFFIGKEHEPVREHEFEVISKKKSIK